MIDAAVVGIEAHGALRDGGTFVALVRPFAPPPIRGTRVVVHEVQADGARLTELAALVDFGVLTPRVAASVPLADTAEGANSALREAHARLDAGGVPGRLVLVPCGASGPRPSPDRSGPGGAGPDLEGPAHEHQPENRVSD